MCVTKVVCIPPRAVGAVGGTSSEVEDADGPALAIEYEAIESILVFAPMRILMKRHVKQIYVVVPPKLRQSIK